jgi:hypothetical protein
MTLTLYQIYITLWPLLGDVKLKKKEADKAEYLAGHADRERVRAEGLAEARREQEEEEKRLYNVFLAKVEASERAEEEKRRKKAVAEAKRQEEATEHKVHKLCPPPALPTSCHVHLLLRHPLALTPLSPS